MRERMGTRVLCGGEEDERSGKGKWAPEIGDHRRFAEIVETFPTLTTFSLVAGGA